MKLTIEQFESSVKKPIVNEELNCYYIDIESEGLFDYEVAERLGMRVKQFREICIQLKGFISKTDNNMIFKNKEDAEAAIVALNLMR